MIFEEWVHLHLWSKVDFQVSQLAISLPLWRPCHTHVRHSMCVSLGRWRAYLFSLVSLWLLFSFWCPVFSCFLKIKQSVTFVFLFFKYNIFPTKYKKYKVQSILTEAQKYKHTKNWNMRYTNICAKYIYASTKYKHIKIKVQSTLTKVLRVYQNQSTKYTKPVKYKHTETWRTTKSK
jgi:hypothetical protein